MKKIVNLVLLFGLSLSFSACQLRSKPEVQSTPESALYTQAAQTVVAQLTQNAQPIQPGDLSTLPAITATQNILTPDFTATPTENFATATPEVNIPSETPSPSPTSTALPITPTSTPSEEDITKSLGGPTWVENFDDANNWSFAKEDRISMEVLDGKAVLIAKNPDYFYGWSVSWPKPADFYVEITATTGPDCSGLDKYGLIFRSVKPSEGYLLGFTCDGRYRVWYYTGSDEVIIKDWTKSEKILSGPNQTNRVGIKAVGNKISVYANGIEIASFSDDRQLEGNFGLMIGSVNTTNFTVYVEKLMYWEIK